MESLLEEVALEQGVENGQGQDEAFSLFVRREQHTPVTMNILVSLE